MRSFIELNQDEVRNLNNTSELRRVGQEIYIKNEAGQDVRILSYASAEEAQEAFEKIKNDMKHAGAL